MGKNLVAGLLAGCSAACIAVPALARAPSGTQDSAPGAAAGPLAADPANATARPESNQDATSGAAPAQAGSDIVVTGTRIVRDGYTAPTPVTVATTEELAKTTPSSVTDALNKLPQFNNSLSPAKSANNFSNLPIHGNILNLRGLGTPGSAAEAPKGPLRTLILFDGIRVSPTEYVGTIDTNVLPQLLMQRVDVVTGGASAAWGSDAVAGVVNFVLDKKFTGFRGIAQTGVSERGDAANQRVGGAFGTSFADDRGHLLLSGEYSNGNGLRRNQREFATKGYNFVGSNSAACTIAANGQSRTCPAGGTATNPYIIGTNILISALAPTGRIVGSSVAGNPFVGRVVNPDGTTRAFDLGIVVGTSGFQSGGDGYRIPDDNFAIIPLRNYNTFGRLSYDLTPDITAYAQGLYALSKYRYTSQQNALVPPGQAVSLFKGNPYLSPALDAALPTANDFYTFGQYNAGQPKPVVFEKTNYWLVTGGLTGKIRKLNWSINYTHGDSVHHMDNTGLYDNKKLFAAVDAVRNPANGQITCRVLLDPTVAAQYAGCQPLNVLNGNPAAASPAGYAYATGTSSYRAAIKQDAVTANLSGSLFNLPAGPVDFAIGAEYRKQSLLLTSNADPSTLVSNDPNLTPTQRAAATAAIRAAYFAGERGVPATALYYWLTNVGFSKGSVNVKEGYAELAVPILKDVSFFKELSLNGAVRVTDYSTSGTVKTYKGGVTWRPVNDLLLRGTYSRDIRAPNLFELFAGQQSGITILNDVAIRDANGNPVYGSAVNQNVNTISSGNRNLRPEIAKTYTFGAVVSPTFLSGVSLSIDYYNIKINKLIASLSAQQIATNCFNAGGSGVPECALITRTAPTAFPSLISTVPANIAFLKTAGIDFDLTYRTAISTGSFSARLFVNYLSNFKSQQYAGAPIAHYAGVSVVTTNPVGYPRWRGNLTLDYTNGPFGLTLGEQYIGRMRLDVPGGLVPVIFADSRVKAVFYTDATLRYTIPASGGSMETFITVNNLFDKDPPIIPAITAPGANPPTNIAVYDFVGRAFTAGVRVKF